MQTRNGRAVRFYVIRTGTGFKVMEATDLEIVEHQPTIETVGMPSETLQEAHEKLQAYIQMQAHKQNTVG